VRHLYGSYVLMTGALLYGWISNVSAQINTVPAVAETAAILQQDTTPDSVLHTSTQPDSSKVVNNASFFLRVKKWANENEGFITLFVALIGGSWALFLYLRARARRLTTDGIPDKRTAQQPYLDHIIASHKHLPVAGFETNLRVPIQLENVYQGSPQVPPPYFQGGG